VKKIRKHLGLTQSKFAALLGVHPVTIRKWEAGMQAVSPMAEKLMKLLTKKGGTR